MSFQLKLSPVTYDYVRCMISEFLATFIFLFAVMSAGINTTRANVTQTSIVVGGVVTGFAAVVVLASFGDISGAHFNPAVTFGALLGGKIPVFKAFSYIFMQLVASVVAASFLLVVFPNTNNIVKSVVLTTPSGNTYFQAVAGEFIFTFIFILIVYMVALGVEEIPYFVRINIPYDRKFPISTNLSSQIVSLGINSREMEDLEENDDEYSDFRGDYQTELTFNPASTIGGTTLVQEYDGTRVIFHPGLIKGYYAIAAIGLTLGFLSMISSTISGGAFNPARVFGPELISGYWGSVWVYWVGDLFGSAFATGVFMFFFSSRVFRAVNAPTALLP